MHHCLFDDTANVAPCYPTLEDESFTNWDLSFAYLANADLTNADLTYSNWWKITCPDATMNSDNFPCTSAQLNLA